MYVGRIVMIAKTRDSRLCAGYRVSSRSFPNRRTLIEPGKVRIVPREGYESEVLANPYISYTCLRVICDDTVVVVGNGSHTDPIAEKIEIGMLVRDAITYSLLALDYEKDQYHTPRICAVADIRDDGAGWLGIVRDNGIEVRRLFLEPARFWYVATYEENHICDAPRGEFTATTAEEACEFILTGGIFAERTHPITSVVAISRPDKGFDIASKDVS